MSARVTIIKLGLFAQLSEILFCVILKGIMNLITHKLGVYPGWLSVNPNYGSMFITLRVFTPKFVEFDG